MTFKFGDILRYPDDQGVGDETVSFTISGAPPGIGETIEVAMGDALWGLFVVQQTTSTPTQTTVRGVSPLVLMNR